MGYHYREHDQDMERAKSLRETPRFLKADHSLGNAENGMEANDACKTFNEVTREVTSAGPTVKEPIS